jgi:hypothetical protein
VRKLISIHFVRQKSSSSLLSGTDQASCLPMVLMPSDVCTIMKVDIEASTRAISETTWREQSRFSRPKNSKLHETSPHPHQMQSDTPPSNQRYKTWPVRTRFRGTPGVAHSCNEQVIQKESPQQFDTEGILHNHRGTSEKSLAISGAHHGSRNSGHAGASIALQKFLILLSCWGREERRDRYAAAATLSQMRLHKALSSCH